MKTGALKQRKNATATIRSGNDDCHDVRKISIFPTPPRDDEKKVGIPVHYWRQYSLIS
ncbi:hypothetical protein [Shigella boydii]|uniref:hypothetical protein n=1 Tax=Shigella boydii TaxID=621 RepID=UPI0021F5E81A|nr:hypothetical protein [Shigella boydii]